jgi:hypothetical protein
MTNQSSNTVSYTSTSTSTSSTDGETSGHRSYVSATTTPSGTTVTTSSHKLGEPATEEVRHYDTQGRAIEFTNQSNARIQDVSDEEQAKRDAEYEERMEDE